MKTNSWKFLRPNDSVDIIAPASHSPIEKIIAGVQWLESIELTPHVPKDIIKTDLFFASSLESQIEQLKNALYSPSKAIWCLRGGYGSMRLIPFLKKIKPPKTPKLFIGFSDITALHLFLSQEWKWPVIHGRNFAQMSVDLKKTPDRKLLAQIIFGKKIDKTFKNLTPLNEVARINNKISATVTGGNLRIIQSSLGTPWEINTKGKILFLEDVGERGYSIDRMLEQLIQADILRKGPKAVVFGDFTDGNERDGSNLILNALKRFAQKVSYPVLQGLPAGHSEECNFPIPFNTKSTLFLGKKSSLNCHYGGEA